MRNGKIITAAIVLLFGLFFFTRDARAQTATGYTSIDWYSDTNTVDAYSETDEDYDVDSAYGAYVSLYVNDQNWNMMGHKTASDDGTYGFAAVDIQFSGSPDETYTATGFHKAYAQQYDYDYQFWPNYTIIYYDFYYFGNFEGQQIVVPWSYQFLGTGPTQTRSYPAIILGSTFDEASRATDIPVRFTYVAQDYGTANFPNSNDDHTWSVTLNLPSNSPPCTGTTFDMSVHLHKGNYGTLYGALDPRNIPDTPSDS